jgi:deoxyguanosine kinase
MRLSAIAETWLRYQTQTRKSYVNSFSTVQLLHVVGNIGAGKSTVTELLADKLQVGRVDADTFFHHSERLKRLFFEDTPRWAFTVELSLAAKRVSLLRREIKASDPGLMVVDGGVMISWMHARARYESGMMSDDEWAIFSEVFDGLVWDDVKSSKVVLVRCRVEKLIERIHARAELEEARKFEPEAYNAEYLGYLQKGIESLADKIKSEGLDVLEVDAEQWGDIVRNPLDADNLVKQIADGFALSLA